MLRMQDFGIETDVFKFVDVFEGHFEGSDVTFPVVKTSLRGTEGLPLFRVQQENTQELYGIERASNPPLKVLVTNKKLGKGCFIARHAFMTAGEILPEEVSDALSRKICFFIHYVIMPHDEHLAHAKVLTVRHEIHGRIKRACFSLTKRRTTFPLVGFSKKTARLLDSQAKTFSSYYQRQMVGRIPTTSSSETDKDSETEPDNNHDEQDSEADDGHDENDGDAGVVYVQSDSHEDEDDQEEEEDEDEEDLGSSIMFRDRSGRKRNTRSGLDVLIEETRDVLQRSKKLHFQGSRQDEYLTRLRRIPTEVRTMISKYHKTSTIRD